MTDVSTARVPPSVLPKPNDPCWCRSGTKYKKCHREADACSRKRGPETRCAAAAAGRHLPHAHRCPSNIPRPDYAPRVGRVAASRRPAVHPGVIARMRRACRAAAEVLQAAAARVRPGVTTDALDAIAHEEYLKRGGYPSPLNYHGFPKCMCTSVNEVICHGIPDDRRARGRGHRQPRRHHLPRRHARRLLGHLPRGRGGPESERLVRVTRECLMKGIEAVKPGRPISDIGQAIEAHAAKNGLGVVRAYCGHGIGERFHTVAADPPPLRARGDHRSWSPG